MNLLYQNRIAYAPEGASGSGDADAGDKGGAGGLTPESIKAFTESVDKLSGGIQQLNTIATARQQDTSQQNEEVGDTPDPTDNEIDLESLSRRELVDLISKSTLSAIEKRILAPLTKEIDDLKTNMTTKEFGGEIQSLAGQNKDFWDFKEEMKTVSTQHPSMRPKEVYLLAKALNPDKAKELDRKYNPPQDKDNVRRPKFGGLAPSGSGRASDKSKAMPVAEALEDAWNQVNERHGGIFSSLES